MLLIKNADVYAPAARGRADILAAGGQILRIEPGIALPSAYVEEVDAAGLVAVPGFIDGHVHFVSGGLAMDRVNLLDAESLDAIKAKIREFAAANPDRAWVLGRGWYYSPFPGGLPTRQQLDELVPDRPAYMTCYDGHTGWANTAALKLAGITAKSPDPTDGVVVKDPKTGEPTGILKEDARG